MDESIRVREKTGDDVIASEDENEKSEEVKRTSVVSRMKLLFESNNFKKDSGSKDKLEDSKVAEPVDSEDDALSNGSEIEPRSIKDDEEQIEDTSVDVEVKPNIDEDDKVNIDDEHKVNIDEQDEVNIDEEVKIDCENVSSHEEDATYEKSSNEDEKLFNNAPDVDEDLSSQNIFNVEMVENFMRNEDQDDGVTICDHWSVQSEVATNNDSIDHGSVGQNVSIQIDRKKIVFNRLSRYFEELSKGGQSDDNLKTELAILDDNHMSNDEDVDFDNNSIDVNASLLEEENSDQGSVKNEDVLEETLVESSYLESDLSNIKDEECKLADEDTVIEDLTNEVIDVFQDDKCSDKKVSAVNRLSRYFENISTGINIEKQELCVENPDDKAEEHNLLCDKYSIIDGVTSDSTDVWSEINSDAKNVDNKESVANAETSEDEDVVNDRDKRSEHLVIDRKETHKSEDNREEIGEGINADKSTEDVDNGQAELLDVETDEQFGAEDMIVEKINQNKTIIDAEVDCAEEYTTELDNITPSRTSSETNISSENTSTEQTLILNDNIADENFVLDHLDTIKSETINDDSTEEDNLVEESTDVGDYESNENVIDENSQLSRSSIEPTEDDESNESMSNKRTSYFRPAPSLPVGHPPKQHDLSAQDASNNGTDRVFEDEIFEETLADYNIALPAFRMRSSSDSVLTGGALAERVGGAPAAGEPSHATLQRNKSALHSAQNALGGSMTSLTSAPPTPTPSSSLSTSDLSERPRVSHGKPNLAPKPPTLANTTDTRPSPPPKKLIVNGKIASRTQSMRVPRSPPVSPPSPQGGVSRPLQLPPAPINPHIATKNPASHFGTLRAPRGLRPPGVCPPPPPGVCPPPPPAGAPPPPPARHASLAAPPLPPPHHRQHSTVSCSSVEEVGAPAPPVRGSSMRGELEARFGALFRPAAGFPPPDRFLRVAKGYSSTTLTAKAQAPLPPLQVPLQGWSGTSSAC